MNKVLVLRLQTSKCTAEAWLNDMPVLQACDGDGGASVGVNEFVLAGTNELRLEIHPSPQHASAAPQLAFNPAAARAVLLLAHAGEPADATHARRVTEFAWTIEEGELFPASAPVHRFELPVRFPRWRWLDAPVLDAAAAYGAATAFVQELALSLFRADAEVLIAASRVRLDELAVAYGLQPREIADRLRSRVQLLHATKTLRPLIPALGEMQVRTCGGGRLLECLAGGEPALRTQPAADGTQHAWPLRLALIEGRCHVFR